MDTIYSFNLSDIFRLLFFFLFVLTSHGCTERLPIIWRKTNYLSSIFLITVLLYFNKNASFIAVLSSMATQVPIFLFVPLKKDITFLSKCSLMLNGLEAVSKWAEPKWTEASRQQLMTHEQRGKGNPHYTKYMVIVQENPLSPTKFQE